MKCGNTIFRAPKIHGDSGSIQKLDIKQIYKFCETETGTEINYQTVGRDRIPTLLSRELLHYSEYEVSRLRSEVWSRLINFYVLIFITNGFFRIYKNLLRYPDHLNKFLNQKMLKAMSFATRFRNLLLCKFVECLDAPSTPKNLEDNKFLYTKTIQLIQCMTVLHFIFVFSSMIHITKYFEL